MLLIFKLLVLCAALCGTDYMDSSLLDPLHAMALSQFKLKKAQDIPRAIAMYITMKLKNCAKSTEKELLADLLKDAKLQHLQQEIWNVMQHYTSTATKFFEYDSLKLPKDNVTKFEQRLLDRHFASVSCFSRIHLSVPLENPNSGTTAHYAWSTFRHELFANLFGTSTIDEYLTLNKLYKKQTCNNSSQNTLPVQKSLHGTLLLWKFSKSQAEQVVTLVSQKKLNPCYIVYLCILRVIRYIDYDMNGKYTMDSIIDNLLYTIATVQLGDDHIIFESIHPERHVSNVFYADKFVNFAALVAVGFEYFVMTNQITEAFSTATILDAVALYSGVKLVNADANKQGKLFEALRKMLHALAIK